MLNSDEWFSEPCEEGGSAFSLKIKSKLHEERSEYQTITIYDTVKYGKLMVIDGFIMLSSRDNFLYHEMMSHPVLFSHANPKKVIIIGGGDCGTLQEVLKHQSVEEVWQVEIDERVTRLSEEYFPELCANNSDPRAHFYFGDGIKWMADQADNSFDIVIVDSTDPIGPAVGLFQEPFYRDCLRVIGDKGIIAQQSESPLYHMNIICSMREQMQKAGINHLKTLHYPQSVYPSGWWTVTLASQAQELSHFREQDIKQRGFDTRYYNEAIHLASFASPEFMRKKFNIE